MLSFTCLADTTLSELNDGLLREEEGLVANRGLVSTYVGGGLLAGAAVLNDNQTFLAYLTPELRRQYDSMVISQVEQVRAASCAGTMSKATPPVEVSLAGAADELLVSCNEGQCRSSALLVMRHIVCARCSLNLIQLGLK